VAARHVLLAASGVLVRRAPGVVRSVCRRREVTTASKTSTGPCPTTGSRPAPRPDPGRRRDRIPAELHRLEHTQAELLAGHLGPLSPADRA
jgi:hypothetical protein